MRKIHGGVYYFSPKGFMKTGWIKYNNKKYYFGSNGIRYSGVKKISGKMCIRDSPRVAGSIPALGIHFESDN